MPCGFWERVILAGNFNTETNVIIKKAAAYCCCLQTIRHGNPEAAGLDTMVMNSIVIPERKIQRPVKWNENHQTIQG